MGEPVAPGTRSLGFACVVAASLAEPAAAVAPAIRQVLHIVPGPSLLDTFRRPLALAADSTRGVCVVGDTGNHRFVVFDREGRSRGQIACSSDDPQAPACEPRAVALDARGRMYTIDAFGDGIQVLTSRGAVLARLQPQDGAAPPARPQHVAVGASGRIYAAYTGPPAGVLAFEPNGVVRTRIGFGSPDGGGFHGPVCVAADAGESLLAVVDPEADEALSIWTMAGESVARFGRHGEGEGTFSMAVHAAWGPDRTLWVTDTIRHSISVFDDRGTYLGRIGGFGRGPGQFNYPVACAFLASDRLVVLERAGSRLQVLEVGSPRAVEPVAAPADSGKSGTALVRR